MSRTLQDSRHHLHVLACCSPKQRKAILETSDDKLVKALCECSLNLLKGNIPLTDGQKTKLNRHKHILRRLAEKQQSLKSKRELLQQQRGFVGTLLKVILPTLATLLLKR